MSTLDEIVTRNAQIAYHRHRKAKEEAGVKYGYPQLAMDMAKFMVDEKERQAPAFNSSQRVESIALQVRRYLGAKTSSEDRPKPPWRLDYLEAFCCAVGIPPQQIEQFDLDGSKLPSTERSAFFARSVALRLKPNQMKALLEHVDRALERSGMFQLLYRCADAILDASDRQEAVDGVLRVLMPVRKWPPLLANSSRPRGTRKKSG